MTDPIELEQHPLAEPIKPKPKGWPKGKSRKKPTPPQEFKAPAEFAGLTENSCCDACTPAHCVISGTMSPAHSIPARVNHFGQMMPAQDLPDSTVCGHPFKTPVNVFVAYPKVVERYQRARKLLEHLMIDTRNVGLTGRTGR